MFIEEVGRNKTYPRFLILCAIFLILILLARHQWQPFLDRWRCRSIAEELSKHYGLVVRYGDPTEFYVQPEKPLENVLSKGFFIERTDPHFAITALLGVRRALASYPVALIKKNVSAVFITGMIKTYGVQIGGSYFKTWIYLSALQKYEQAGIELYVLNFHHELSSLFMNATDFKLDRWAAINEDDFNYLPRQIDVVNAASNENCRDSKATDGLYQAGFVDAYGMSSLENDVNMYAELAMTHPGRLRELAAQYPRIRAKTRILVEFYSSLAPELRDYFKHHGLIDSRID
jgi:hypothetical protein